MKNVPYLDLWEIGAYKKYSHIPCGIVFKEVPRVAKRIILFPDFD